MDTEELSLWIALQMIPQIGEKTCLRLIEHFGGPRGVFSASASELRSVGGISTAVVEGIKGFRDFQRAREEVKRARKIGVDILTFHDKDYPENLRNIQNPPPILYIRGKLEKSDSKAVAIVGSRKASSYGKTVAETLAHELSSLGITIISGMAAGIDSSAHQGALKGGRTIAVLGSGVNIIYPKWNRRLYERIMERGAVLSQFPLDTEPRKLNFPLRNRIISGLSKGVVIVEAARKSGALITAYWALEQGREVFAVPGSIFSENSRGPHMLIKSGAKVVESIDDILEEIFQEYMGSKEQKAIDLTPDEEKILDIVKRGYRYMDEIIEISGKGAAEVGTIIMGLELKGLIAQMDGSIFFINRKDEER